MKNVTFYIVSIFVLVILGGNSLSAQQLPQSSLFNESKAFWNPAYTGVDDAMSVNARIRQQWIGFGSNAPRNINLDFQYPFLDYKMAAGAQVVYDQVGPVGKFGFALNYAYSLVELGRNEGKLTFGITAGGTQYRYDPSEEVIREAGDPLLESGTQTSFFPNVGVGAFYISTVERYDENVAFYVGLSGNQAYQTNVLTAQLNQKRAIHANFDLGAKIYNYNGYLEPYLSVNYSDPDILHSLFGLKYEMKDTFWAGFGYVTSGDVAIQAGVIIPGVNGSDSRMKIGALGNIPMADGLSEFGPTAEVYFRYEYDQW